MNGGCFIILFSTVVALDARPSEFVWLRDLNNDAHKRHIDLGLSEKLRFQLNAGKKSINLHLQENPHIRADTDIYVVKEMPDGTKRAVKEPFTGNVESKYYHDIDNYGVFTVRCVKRANGPCARTLEGSLMIGDNYFHIAPVTVNSFSMNREYQDTPHEIREEMAIGENIILMNDTIKPILDEEEDVKKSLFVNMRRSVGNQNVEESDFDKNKRATTVYGVELFVAVDPPVWEKFYSLASEDTDNAMNRVREYVSHVINGVAMTYKSIQGRAFSIQITLKAITVIKKVEDGPSKDLKITENNGERSIDDSDYLDEFADWVVKTPGIPSRSEFDHATMLTGYNLIGSQGLAWLGTLCSKIGASVAMEAGYFKTMIVASHEIAHGIGADHDADVGCPTAYIMGMNVPKSVDQYSHKAWEFSECSIDAFAKTLAKKSCVKDEATFYNKNEYDNYNKLYPGQIYSPDEQCKVSFGLNSYTCGTPDPDTICLSLSCYKPTKEHCVRQIAADGTQCGTGHMWCIDGLCVSKPSGVTTPKPTTTTINGKKTPTQKPATTTVNGKKTTTLKSKIPSSTSAPSTNPPLCKDSKECKQLYQVYNHKKRFCSDMGELCCEMCKGERKCEDTGYMDLSCADIRSFYSKKSKFCSKWSVNCCATCSKTVNG